MFTATMPIQIGTPFPVFGRPVGLLGNPHSGGPVLVYQQSSDTSTVLITPVGTSIPAGSEVIQAVAIDGVPIVLAVLP